MSLDLYKIQKKPEIQIKGMRIYTDFLREMQCNIQQYKQTKKLPKVDPFQFKYEQHDKFNPDFKFQLEMENQNPNESREDYLE